MKKLFGAILIFSQLGFANGIECAIQTRDASGTSSGEPHSFGTMHSVTDEIWTTQEDYFFWANMMSDNTVGVVIEDRRNNVMSNAIGASVNWDFYTVMAQSFEGTGDGRSGTLLCRQSD